MKEQKSEKNCNFGFKCFPFNKGWKFEFEFTFNSPLRADKFFEGKKKKRRVYEAFKLCVDEGKTAEVKKFGQPESENQKKSKRKREASIISGEKKLLWGKGKQ